MTLLIANLPCQALQTDLLELFEEYGPVRVVTLVSGQEIGRVCSFGLVEMVRRTDEQAALCRLNGSKWLGERLQINEVSVLEYMT